MRTARLFGHFAGQNPCEAAKCNNYEQCAINRQGIANCECGPECEPVMRPVCARGGTTYTSMCELKRQACLTRSNIEVAYVGTCGSRGPCSEKVGLSYFACATRLAKAVFGRSRFPLPRSPRSKRQQSFENRELLFFCLIL